MAAVHPDPDGSFEGVLPSASAGGAGEVAGKQPLKDRGSDGASGSEVDPRVFVLVHPGNAHEGKLSVISVFGKQHEVCWRSLFVFPVNGVFRQKIITFVVWKWFDRFILFLIMLNSVLLASYQNRANPGSAEEGWNWVVDSVVDPILTVLFTLEFLLKVIAWGFFLDKRSYLRELWNWLDFVVVVTALIAFIPGMDSGLGFLRLFRILRPLRSLKQVPQMKVLVNTVISSIPRLANVSIMMFFFFWIFGIIGITLLDGVFYHGCRTTPAPVLRSQNNGTYCWDWPLTGDGRLCGGRYMCDAPPDGVSVGYCGGREDDPNKDLRPVFPGGRQGHPWCEEPKKIFPETDFIHFDNMGGALLAVFQCMTMEGWTDIMYYVQDGFGFWVGTIYFFTLIPITSFFLLNLALAVVDEAREDFDDGEEEDEEDEETADPNAEGGDGEEVNFMAEPDPIEELWFNHAVVRLLRRIAFNEVFTNFVMLFIAGNVVTMMLESYPPVVVWQEPLGICEKVFLGIFCVEMVIMLGALGPKGYVLNPVTCFDGFIVIISLIQIGIGGGGSAFTALRTLRLFRVLNKLANRWPSFRVLLKAMVQTGISLNYWLVLFFLFLYIWTLMWMSFFNRQFHFQDLDTFNAPSADQGQAWCGGSEGESDVSFRQDCIPRAHFDTFLWAFVTIFQIMTGENWNWIMYAGMRAQHWIFAGIFIALIVFGQILFLSLFLSMLMSKFNKVQDTLERRETKRLNSQSRSAPIKNRGAMWTVLSVFSAFAKAKDAVGQNQDRDRPQPIVPVDGEATGSNAPHNRGRHSATLNRALRLKEEKDEPSLEILPGQPDTPVDHKVSSPKKGDASKSSVEVSAPKPWQDDDEQLPKQRSKEAFVAKDEQAHGKESGKAPLEGTPKGQPPKAVEGAPPALVIPGDERQPWPYGYAWFILSEENPVRQGCRWILTKEVCVFGSDINAFDNLILLCILISTVCMALDFPLRDPGELFTKVLRQMDFVFKIIFIVEMALKLLACGLVWGKDAYLRSGWNWLDGIVVVVSIVGMVSSGSTGFLKTLRILRAFRPLRVISRNQNLKVVVQTIFASLPALVTLVIVCLVFLLIFALFALSYLNGTFYSCQAGSTPVVLEKDLGTTTPATPLCLSPNVSASHIHSACPRGMFRTTGSSGAWIQDNLPCPWPTDGSNCAHTHTDLTLAWQRVSADTPICVGRCDLHNAGGAPEWLCPRRYQTQAELPHNCAGPRTVTPEVLAAEQIGAAYQSSMQRALVMPCGGSGISSVDGGFVEDQASVASCRAAFCPGEVPAQKRSSCEATCRIHPHFCADICANSEDTSPKCRSCRKECEAACHCDGFCQPLIKDAALCHEQGGAWMPSLPQNFNNVWNSLLTLFEISSTEGWVDVMYAACDSRQPYEEPKRDHQQWLFAPFFVFYIFISFMFLLNLSVGVIVDNFIDLKESGKKVMLTPAQEKWIKSQKGLLSKATLFNMRNLHLLPKFRRRVYDIVASKSFEAFMTGTVVVNTIVLATKAYPWPTDWWESAITGMDYVFTLIFCVEFVMKFYALRNRYWMDAWNKFDFSCVVVSIVGFILSLAAPELEIVKSLSQIFRIFRIARLFRLLRTMKKLNQIFMAFVLSLPKLGNVLMVLLLLMVLYGILGVSLFSTVHHSEWLSIHGNFMNFGWAFITLFRAVTGEAWNSIMHDLMKSEIDYFREGSWCTPDDLFDTSTEETYNMLKSKCLLDVPNSCVQTMWGWNIFPVIYWVTYILFIQLMVMNLVIAVILEGYEDGKKSPESEVIDLCIQKWEKYDSDHKMTIPLPQAFMFIQEVITELTHRSGEQSTLSSALEGLNLQDSKSAGCHLDRIPMHFAKYFTLNTSADGRVHWLQVSKQVLRFTCTEDNEALLKEVEDCEKHMDKRLINKLGKLENKRSKMLGMQDFARDFGQVDLRAQVAATKLQRYFRGMPRGDHVKSTVSVPSQSHSAAATSSMANVHSAPT